MVKSTLKLGQEKIECPQSMFEMADRLASDLFFKEVRYGTMPTKSILGTIYLMGFMHSAEAFLAKDK